MKAKYLDISIDDALDNLFTISFMEINLKESIGIVKKNHLVLSNNKEFDAKDVNWVMLEDPRDLIENIKKTYQTIYEYIKALHDNKLIDFGEEDAKKGILSIITLGFEAQKKIDSFLELSDKKIRKISSLEEFKAFKKFYNEVLIKKFDEDKDLEGNWQKNWFSNKEALLMDIEKSGLKDFNSIKEDLDYEIFYLKDDEESPYFNDNLINNLKLYCAFDEKESKKILEDPLLKIREFIDKDYQLSAKHILEENRDLIDKYFHTNLAKEKSFEIVKYLNEAIFALMICSNPKNLIKNTIYKNSIEYFYDFTVLLRKLLSSEEYKKVFGFPEDNKNFFPIVNIAKNITRSIFIRHSNIKQEFLGFIYYLVEQGEKNRNYSNPKKMGFLLKILENEESIIQYLKKYPSGPLMKLLDTIYEEKTEGFDPYIQGNIASKYFEVLFNKTKLSILRVPSITMQTTIKNVHIIEEFKNLIFSMKDSENFLYINLQDRTSYYEAPRSLEIERLNNNVSFNTKLNVFTIDKKTSFYSQSGPYFNLNNKEAFISEFKKEIFSHEYGFFIKNTKEISKSITDILNFISKNFFYYFENLSREQRLDFIELFYNFFVLKLIEIYQPSYMCFSCKDSVDFGPLSMGSFYMFLKLLKNKPIEKKEEDFFKYVIFEPALIIRERSVIGSNLNRILSSLNLLERLMLKDHKRILKDISSIYDPSFLKSISITEK